MMYELKEQDDSVRLESKFSSQDVGLIEGEEKCLQPLLEVKSEPEEVEEDFAEDEPKCAYTVKVEEEEAKPVYQLVPSAKDQIQKMMYELKDQDDGVRLESNFPSQDVGLIEAEEKCLQPLLEVKSEPKEMKEDFGEVEQKYDCTIKVEEEETNPLYELVPFSKERIQEMKEDFGEVERKYGCTINVEEEETNPLYQLVPFSKDRIQLLDEMINSENSGNECDKIKYKEDQKLLSGMSDNSRTPSMHGTVNVEPDRNYDVHVINDRTSCNTVIHTNIRPFSCDVCGKSFKQRSNLKTHLLIHPGNRRFSCEECGKTSNVRSNLQKHLLIHTGNRQFSCEECGKSFIHRSHLKSHLLIHNANRQFSCEECGKTFNHKCNLKTHLLILTGSRPFSCEECGKSFNLRSHQNTHLLIHNGNCRTT